MRFKILPYKKSRKEATASKLRSAERRLKKEREKYPLLVDWIIEQQPTAEEKVGRQLDDWHKWCQEARNRQAQGWRKSRAILYSLTSRDRAKFLEYWNNSNFPGDPGYFIYALRKFIDGKVIDLT
jgi:hypothetical protein